MKGTVSQEVDSFVQTLSVTTLCTIFNDESKFFNSIPLYEFEVTYLKTKNLLVNFAILWYKFCKTSYFKR